MKQRGANILRSLDWPVFMLYTALVFLGWFNIHAAVFDDKYSSIFDFAARYGKQLVWIGVSYIIIILIMASNYRIYSVLSYFIYGGIIILLMAVLVVGTKTNGARSWFEIGNLKIQPAEFAKFATALALSKFMSAYDFNLNKLRDLIMSASIILLPAGLILLQPDMGSVLVYFSLIFVFYREGMTGMILLLVVLGIAVFVTTLQYELSVVIIGLVIVAGIWHCGMGRSLTETLIAWGIIIVLTTIFWVINHFALNDKFEFHFLIVAASLLLLPVALVYSYMKKNWTAVFVCGGLLLMFVYVFSVDFVFNNVMTDHQQTLIRVFLGLEVDPQGTGYNVEQSKIAIGSGGFAGKGYLQGTQTKYNFVPEQATDFIFCTVGEEWGFLGSTIVIGLFLTLILRIIYLAEKQRSVFSRIYGYCVASILFFHVAINVGMTIGLVPVIGIPLPFFSYGGSSLWSFTILLFIFVRMDASRDELL
ncbi:MAG: rod shape-determining protein RodA [Bacteroidales bacterium]|nr:rod shape-determining protein RodA [Bacteroidales bacterium]